MLFYLLCGAWFSGLYLGQLIPASPERWLLLAAIALAAALIFRAVTAYRIAFLCLLALTLAGARFQSNLPTVDPGHIAYYNELEHRAQITGVIAEDPVWRAESVDLVLVTERVWIADLELAHSIEGRLLVNTSRAQTWRYGDWVQVTGNVETPPSGIDFDYAEYLQRKGILSWMTKVNIRLLEHDHGKPWLEAIYRLRNRFLQIILHIFPDPEAQLLSGILLGVESGIPEDVQTAFNRTGTTHIIAISGFNLTLLAQASIRICGRWLGKRRGSFVAGTVILLYTVMVGAQAAVVRAAIMAILGLLAFYLGRVNDALRALCLAGVLMSVLDPFTPWDVGFQLSFAATLGLILYADPLQKWVESWLTQHFNPGFAKRTTPLLGEYALFTFAAQLTTLPITVLVFRRLSLVSLAANMTILPLQPGLMFLGGSAMIAGTILQPLGQLLAWLAWPFAAATIRLVSLWSGLALASIPLGELDGVLLIAYYAMLFGVTLLLSRRDARTDLKLLSWARQALSPALLLSGLFLAALLSWHAYLYQPDGQLHINLLDVGAGDAILIETPAGGRVLIDGGPSTNRLADRLSHYSSLFDKRIEWLVLAGGNYDQLGGLLGLVERFPIEQVLVGIGDQGSTARRVLEELGQHAIRTIDARQGSRLELGGGAILEVLHAGHQGLLLEVQYAALRVLLAPGADPASIDSLLQQPDFQAWSAVILPGCGETNLFKEPWRMETRVGWILLSCDAGTAPPDPKELPDLLARHQVFRTDIHGDIRISSNGDELWIDVERAP
jgi:competence protein ComEC